MYNRFFGFKERPFRLVPNPAYLFLSKSHQEAMAHLVYAVGAGDGFVELTGEVGTGKTTLCRAFFETLDENTEVAYIFNPVLDPVELIKAINDEFRINSAGDNTKDLIHTLNAFLIEKKTEGKNVILVIDEAQNLAIEVLEQIRLISNLETTQSKLLQIVLVGQPELGILLNSHGLRQLKQRITLSCRLQPLTYKETEGYVHHRVRIASGEQAIVFSRGAIQRIYRYSRGIPRLINITCDRALLAAYGLDKKKVSAKTAAIAVRELGSRTKEQRFDFQANKKTTAAVACMLAAIILITLYFFGIIDSPRRAKSVTNNFAENNEASQVYRHLTPITPAPVVAPSSDEKQAAHVKSSDPAVNQTMQTPVVPSSLDVPQVNNVKSLNPVANNEIGLRDVLRYEKLLVSRSTAFKTVMALWNIDAGSTRYLNERTDDLTFFKLAGKQNGFTVYRLEHHLDLIFKLNLPAILRFDTTETGTPAYIVLTKITETKLTFKGLGDEVITTSPREAKVYWSGVAYIPWKNFFALNGTIPVDSAGESIITLKLLLRDIGFEDIELSPAYDQKTREAITRVQIKHDLAVDGVVGPMTKIALYNEKRLPEIPHLRNP